jgi:hypothetical protein
MAHQRVDLTGEDFDKLLNFMKDMLSNYTDDQHIHDVQYNPKTNRTEKIESSDGAVLVEE